MAAKKYRMLKEGEVVLPTDQVHVGDPINKWLFDSLNCGKKLPAEKVGLYRCLNTKETGRTVRAKRPAQQRKAEMPICSTYKRCKHSIKGGYCGGKGSRDVCQMGCYKPARSSVA